MSLFQTGHGLVIATALTLNVSQFAFLQLKQIPPALSRACRRSGQSPLPDPELNFSGLFLSGVLTQINLLLMF